MKPLEKFRKKDLEMRLQTLDDVPTKNPEFEQYSTPANLAADILFTALLRGDIIDKKVTDLGCGNGIFAIGAALLGAEKVIGLDRDERSVALARKNAEKLGVGEKIAFFVGDVREMDERCDSVIQNPPFGAQKRKADRAFIETGMRIASVVYSLHLTATEPFIRSLVGALDGTITGTKRYAFPIKHTFAFHTKERVDVGVTLFRIETQNGDLKTNKRIGKK